MYGDNFYVLHNRSAFDKDDAKDVEDYVVSRVRALTPRLLAFTYAA